MWCDTMQYYVMRYDMIPECAMYTFANSSILHCLFNHRLLLINKHYLAIESIKTTNLVQQQQIYLGNIKSFPTPTIASLGARRSRCKKITASKWWNKARNWKCTIYFSYNSIFITTNKKFKYSARVWMLKYWKSNTVKKNININTKLKINK